MGTLPRPGLSSPLTLLLLSLDSLTRPFSAKSPNQRSNVVTEDIGKLFVRKHAEPSSQ